MKFIPFILAFGVAGLAASAVQAQESCACVEPLGAGPVAGSITSASSDVLVSGGNGFVAAEGGVPLSVGSRILTGPDGAASIAVGQTCSISVAPNTSVDIVAVDQQLCVRTASVEGTPPSTGGNGSVAAAVVAAGSIPVVVGAVIIGSEDDDGIDGSPPVSLGQ